MSSCALFAYSEFVLYKKSEDMYILKEAFLIEGFFPLVSDVGRYMLGAYFLECASEVSYSGVTEKGLLILALRSLYALMTTEKKDDIIKAAFETRLCTVTGTSPLVSGCAGCGKPFATDAFFDVSGGVALCNECFHKKKPDGESGGSYSILTPSALSAIDYCEKAPGEKLFSFELKGESREQFCKASEKYLVYRFGKRLKTLEMYGQFKKSEKDNGI